MLQAIARLAIAAPRRIIALALLVMAGTAIFGIPVTKSLSAGGFQDPTSQSSQAARLLSDKFGQGDMQMLISVTSEDGAQSDGRTRRRHRYRHATQGVAECGPGDFGVDRAAPRPRGRWSARTARLV